MSRAEARDEVERLAEWIAEAERITAFTGAGVSTECGIPDFRSADSPWRVHKPIPFADFLAEEAARVEAWKRKFAIDDVHGEVSPGRVHRILAQWATQDRVGAVITQNIDDLHRRAGTPEDRLVELHGNGSFAACLDCGLRHELPAMRAFIARTGRSPVCDACEGLVKSATIAFGQSMPPEPMRRARRASLDCDLFLVLGSSLVVRPAAAFPEIAKQAGARLVIVNRDPTPLDAVADLIVRDDVGDVLARTGRDDD